MDQETNSALVITSILLSVVGALIAAVNHQRVRSTCCGRKVEIKIDIDKVPSTPPEPPQPV